MTKILTEFLKPGGKLIVSDFHTDSGEVRKDFAPVVRISHPLSGVLNGCYFAGTDVCHGPVLAGLSCAIALW